MTWTKRKELGICSIAGIPLLFFLILTSCDRHTSDVNEGVLIEHLHQKTGTDLIITAKGDSLLPYVTQAGDTILTGQATQIAGKLQAKKQAPNTVHIGPAQFLRYANGLQKIGNPMDGGLVEVTSEEQYLELDTIQLNFETENVELSRVSTVEARKVHSPSPYRIRKFDQESGMLDDYTSLPVTDSKGKMWYMNDAFVSFDGKQVREYIAQSGLKSVSGRFSPDEIGRLWFKTGWSSRLNCFDGNQFLASDVYAVPIGNDSKGRLYVGKDSVIYRIERNTLVPILSIPWYRKDFRRCYSNAQAELVLIGHGSRWHTFKDNVLKTFHLPGAGRIASVIDDRQGGYWIGGRNGLFHYNPLTGIVLHYDESTGLSGHNVREILMDYEGDLWVSYYKGGVDVIVDEGIFSLDINIGYSIPPWDPNDQRIYEDEDKQIWLCTQDKGFILLDKGLITNIDFGLDQDEYIGGLVKDDQERFWFSTNQSLYQYNPIDNGIYKMPSLTDEKYSEAFVLAVNGNEIWICSNRNKVFLGRLKSDSLTIYREDQGLMMIGSDMKFDRFGTLWIGGFHGLHSFDGHYFTDRLPAFDGSVNTVSTDHKGNMILAHSYLGIMRHDSVWEITSRREGLPAMAWKVVAPNSHTQIVGTWTHGCIFIQDTAFIHLNVLNGMNNNLIRSIATDQNGVAWIMTPSGLNAFKISDVSDYIEGRKSDFVIDYFKEIDGLHEIIFGNHVDKIIHDDNLYIPNGNRIIKVNIEEYANANSNYDIVLTDLKFAEKSYDFQIDSTYEGIEYKVAEPFTNIPRYLELAHYHNHLTFHFQALNYQYPNKTRYQFRIKELNNDWSVASPINQADFRNLPPGMYTFEVRSISNGLRWSTPFSYHFLIKPAWYETIWAFAGYAIGLIVLVIIIVRWRTAKLTLDKLKLEGIVQERTQDLREEKEKSDDLLLNILPERVAQELKDKGEAEAQLIDQVTVLFTDFKGFTTMSEKLSPKELVNDLNTCFSEFDRITAKYGIEKIKTIGDAYMAAGGLPTPNSTHPENVINAALEMRDFVEIGKRKKIKAGLPYFEIRIGVHTGPVVAGIVGVKKFQYDIWGDTVNTASRMESSGEVGQVNISADTYMLVKENSEFNFTSRGKVEAKGKGEIEMYYVSKAE